MTRGRPAEGTCLGSRVPRYDRIGGCDQIDQIDEIDEIVLRSSCFVHRDEID
jgi:hypothetical protein